MPIVYQNKEGGVSILTAAPGFSDDYVAEKDVPDDCEHQIYADSEVFLPTDGIFRDAWTWAGKGHVVIEDLEASKQIAIATMREQTLADAKAAAEEAFFNDTPSVSEADVKSMYVSAESDINACTDTYAVKCLLCAFMGWEEPELPRDQKLKAKAEKAAAKLRIKLERLKTEVLFRVALAKKVYRLKEQIGQSEQTEATAR